MHESCHETIRNTALKIILLVSLNHGQCFLLYFIYDSNQTDVMRKILPKSHVENLFFFSFEVYLGGSYRYVHYCSPLAAAEIYIG